ncbi:DUF2911 domain-containing protein [Flagellimonas myxillae]|uniref:DUF2911 domain-containing protein n=1 Tax=Flagellimonas myxillae TaxID=2942214 RepID=UPI00201F8CD6|nr:DUF2911 domain-containing protein [Muricauda myxillae]MCL6265912.1 DUF2911 domain-containing protein [Muricauda myxillae]
MKTKSYILTIIFTLALVVAGQAQDMLVATKVSPKSSITQRIGTTDVTVDYHSPSAKNRKIFGGIVPFNFVVDGVEYPWRAGSNQNTTIEFTHDVSIQGKPLAKGKYGLHIFVQEKEWTFIFSNNSENWGSFSYKKDEDALRLVASPTTSPYQENLRYDFVSLQPETAELELRWSTLKCGVVIAVDVNANVLADLKAKEEKTVDDYVKIAQLTASSGQDKIGEALDYVEKSFELGPEFRNLMLKSQLLAKQGKQQESQKFKEQALEQGKGFPYFYYFPLSFMLLENNAGKTYKLLSQMLQENPENWIANLAMGEYYIKAGDQKKATYHFGKAYEHAGERSKDYTRYMYLSNKLILEGS